MIKNQGQPWVFTGHALRMRSVQTIVNMRNVKIIIDGFISERVREIEDLGL